MPQDSRPCLFAAHGSGFRCAVHSEPRPSSHVATIASGRVQQSVRSLIDGGVRLGQHEGRNLDIKMLFTVINHLVGSVHRAEGHGQRTT